MNKKIMAFVPTLPFLLTMACDTQEGENTTNEPVETTEASDEDLDPDEDPEPVEEEAVNADPDEDNAETPGHEVDEANEEESVEHDEHYFTENIVLNHDQFFDEEYGLIPLMTITASASDLDHRLLASFTSSDRTQGNITEYVTNIEIDEDDVIHFTFSDDLSTAPISMASTESRGFMEMLHAVSDGFGAEQMNFYTGDEPGVLIDPLAEMEEVPVELEEGIGYYRPTISSEDSEYENVFIPSRVTDDPIISEDFGEVLRELQTFEGGAYYESPISDVIELHDAWIEDDGKAQLHYSITDESEWDEEQQQAFEYAVFLTALDFNATNARLVDEGNQEILDFPLLEDRDPHANQPEH
ncbi:hypothetical protein [Geomicrobium sp. JCM 19055]|uniref:hypothetical protein n=1 Tax=Geomicrobium sp. JCM 19055 TaxID=1460649 RepID=UPI0005AB1CB9|nr:hypothetical protein [Geomicrobium sp. JCM 19055]